MYTGIKEVRKHNEQEFIDDFKRLNSFVVRCEHTGIWLGVSKLKLWEIARSRRIEYVLTDEIYILKRTSMHIL